MRLDRLRVRVLCGWRVRRSCLSSRLSYGPRRIGSSPIASDSHSGSALILDEPVLVPISSCEALERRRQNRQGNDHSCVLACSASVSSDAHTRHTTVVDEAGSVSISSSQMRERRREIRQGKRPVVPSKIREGKRPHVSSGSWSSNFPIGSFSVAPLLSLGSSSQTARPLGRSSQTFHLVLPLPTVGWAVAEVNRQKRKLIWDYRSGRKKARLLLPPFSKEHIALLKGLARGHSYYGGPEYVCGRCNAFYWYHERCKSESTNKYALPVYNGCCRGGKVSLPKFPDWPFPLNELLRFDNDVVGSQFLRLIRHYNSMFAFTSLGAEIDKSVNAGGSPYVFKMCGTVYHRIGSLLPPDDGVPKFAQLYIVDSADELQRRLDVFGSEGNGAGEPDPFVVQALIDMSSSPLEQVSSMEGPSLKNFDRSSLRWKIVARIARLWEHSSIDKTEFYGLIFVMVDKKNNTLEGLIPAESVPKFKEKVQEGVVYTIEKFDAIKARQKYKAVDHPWRLCFIPRTLVEPIIPQPENFPMLACTLLPFSQLERRMKEIVIMSDVVGRVTSFTEIIPPSGNAREQRRQVFITDGSQNAVVTLWGESANAFDASRVLQRSKHEPTVAIFVAVFVDQYSAPGPYPMKSSHDKQDQAHLSSPKPQSQSYLKWIRRI